MKKYLLFSALIFSGFSMSSLNAISPEEIVEIHELKPYAKAKRQWQRIFKKTKKLQKLGLNEYSVEDKKILLEYLINNAADSDNPTVPGL